MKAPHLINATRLLSDLTKLLKRLEGDLLERIEQTPALKASLQTEWQAARAAERCAETFETWADQVITQAGVHWLLSCVFLRFIEDNQLIERPWLGGTPESGRLALVRDRHEAYFRAQPLQNDRHYLLAAFREAGTLPGLQTFFDAAHNPVFRLGLSGDAAMALRQFWQQIDPSTGLLVHDFTDPAWSTRFLGDLYQDLSEATRKRYALLQTPEFVEEFILERTLTPALREFGWRQVRMIDPTCGSGHFLLGGFYRLLAEWQRHEPSRNPVDLAQKALDAVAGVDLNPFAVAIARFRLFVAALQASGVQRLANAHDFKVHVAIGDSLLHGTRFGLTQNQALFDEAQSHADTGLAHAYASEDLAAVQRILGRQYHAVVGNPPYILVKDAALNAAYRLKYASCHMKYSLGVPFTERFFDLAVTGSNGSSAGFVGLITTNSFMKREFGSKLIEQVLPRLDLTHVVDTSGAYIPGHGTPTVILLGRHRAPVGAAVRTVMGIKGEPSTPADPARGLVWSAIVGQIDSAGSESEYVSVGDTLRATFAKHPWSIGGGGAAELREQIEQAAVSTLASKAQATGVMVVTGEDEIFIRDHSRDFDRIGVPEKSRKVLVEGDLIRDWSLQSFCDAIYEYDPKGRYVPSPELDHYFWRFRTLMKPAIYFGRTKEQRGMHWREYGVIVKDKLAKTPTITFAEVATHNHFVLDRVGKVFKNSAQVIKLPEVASDDDHVGLLGLLNSSLACFWFQQVCHNKGGPGGGSSKDEKWHDFYAFNATKISQFPLVTEYPIDLARRLDILSGQLVAILPAAHFFGAKRAVGLPTRQALDLARTQAESIRRQMVAWQEELDWHAYGLYGVLPTGVDARAVTHTSPPEVNPGERAFEIVLARRVNAGMLETRWFEWLGIEPVTEIPVRWSAGYREVVQRRIDLIERNRNIALIESMGCKRRWEWPAWADLERSALRNWLLERLEAPALWPASADQPAQLSSSSRLAEAVARDADFMHIAALYAGHPNFDAPQLVAELVASESVPALPVQRYTDTGLRKRAQWQDTWALQRREDAGEHVGQIPVPPKYQSKDFLKPDFWRLRGGLDVPKERWVSYPGCERGSDGSLVIAWAGWTPLQQATAVAGYYMDMKDGEGWEGARLQPLLASLLELLPWLQQWHNELDPVYGERMGDYYRGFVTEEARALGFTLDDLRTWQPAVLTAKRASRRRA